MLTQQLRMHAALPENLNLVTTDNVGVSQVLLLHAL